MSGFADIHKAIVAIWNASDLNDIFKAYWLAANRSKFIVLNDTEAQPDQPFPYCIFEHDPGSVTTRMAGANPTLGHEIRETSWTFRVEAKATGTSSAKTVAASLVEEITKVFGGHPTERANIDNTPMDHGSLLRVKYQNDYGVRTPTRENYSWSVHYQIQADVPVAL